MSLGQRLKLRRQILQISLRDLGEKVGVAHATIDKYERDKLIPNSQNLLKLSKALDISMASLLRPDTQQIQLNQIAYRTKKMLKREEKQINAETKEWLERYLQIEALAGRPRIFEMPRGFPKVITSFDEAENAANDLRNKWDIGTDPIENLINLLEDKGIKIGIIKGITKFDALFTDYAGHKVIVVKENLPRARQRFSIAHELGHCLLKIGDNLKEEVVINRFAGAFLVPSEKVLFELDEKRHKFSIKELLILKGEYGLSMGAWLHRATDLGIISKKEYSIARRYFDKTGWTLKEPDDGESLGESPKLMEKMVLRAHAEGIISTSKAAELLDQSISSFCSIDGESHIECTAILCS